MRAATAAGIPIVLHTVNVYSATAGLEVQTERFGPGLLVVLINLAAFCAATPEVCLFIGQGGGGWQSAEVGEGPVGARDLHGEWLVSWDGVCVS
jgi:hypothetical protein